MQVVVSIRSFVIAGTEKIPMDKRMYTFPVPEEIARKIEGVHMELQTHLPKDRQSMLVQLVHDDGTPLPTYREVSLD